MKILKNKYFELFYTYLKIGLFTFGGGYAMISLIEHEFVEKKQWITSDELVDMISVAEATPGPIAINSATYIGFKVGKFWGSLLATLGVVIPSFLIILLISLFLNSFLEIPIVAAAFKGVKVGVSFLIFTVAFKLIKQVKRKIYNIIMLIASACLVIGIQIFSLNFSTLWIILIGALLGVLYYSLIDRLSNRKDDSEVTK